MTEIFLTAVVGLGLVTCGFFLGKKYWEYALMELLITNGLVKVHYEKDGSVTLIQVDNPKDLD